MSPHSFAALQRPGPQGRRWVHFTKPEAVLETSDPAQVIPILRQAEQASREGLHAIGWISYEASAGFDPHFETHPPAPDKPLLRFTLYKDQHAGLPCRASAPCVLSPFVPDTPPGHFASQIDKVRDAIAAGETYQVNLTYPGTLQLDGSPWDLFRQMRFSQAGQHQAYLEESDQTVISASPELFFRHQGNRIVCRPMKGTAAPDAADALRDSVKDRAENLMIVDMIRNDLGRIATPGTVKTDALFTVETYPSLVQMTSSISATGSESPVDWLSALFPCASITGAPKRNTMHWIRKLETSPRGIYTGCIGGFFADGLTEFNVAIRTAVCPKDSAHIHYHTGCGIVWDSEAEAETRESLLKTRVLHHQPPSFHLLETLRADAEGLHNPEAHLKRLSRSAACLGFEFSNHAVQTALDEATADLQGTQKIRLLLAADGTPSVESTALPPPVQSMSFGLDPLPTPSSHPELRHKTTRRDIYTSARQRSPETDETLLINQRGELMEFTIGNLVLDIGGQLFTPPVSSGLLPGTCRQTALQDNRIQEHILHEADLDRADTIHLLNDVRGWVPMTRVR